MSVAIRKMTYEEFGQFYQWSVEQQAKELMEELHIAWEDAMKSAIAEISEMLPDGFHTKRHQLMTVVAEDENAGFIWTLHEETNGRMQSFICDFAIWESQRRRGYGSAALYLAEKQAAEFGCRESVLFVKDNNAAAIALYQKAGYRVLRQAGCGMYMIKQLL